MDRPATRTMARTVRIGWRRSRPRPPDPEPRRDGTAEPLGGCGAACSWRRVVERSVIPLVSAVALLVLGAVLTHPVCSVWRIDLLLVLRRPARKHLHGRGPTASRIGLCAHQRRRHLTRRSLASG